MTATTKAAAWEVPAKRFLGERGVERVLFVCLLALAVNAVLIQTVTVDDSPIKNVVRVGALFLVGFAVAAHGSRVPSWLALTIILSAVLMLVRGNPDQLSYIFVLALMPALWSIPDRRVVKLVAVGSVASLALIFAFLWLGVTENELLQPRDRWTFGTQGVPFFFNVVYGALTMLVLFSRRCRAHWRAVVLAGAVALGTYLFTMTDARGGYVSFLAFVALLFLVPRFSRSGAFRAGVAVLPVVCLGAAFLLAAMSERWWALNETLSYRPELYRRFLEETSLADFLLGTSVKNATFAVDNSYIHLLAGGGLLICLVYVVAFWGAVHRLFAAGKHAEIAFLIATSLYYNSESIMLRIENLFVIYAWFLVLRPAEDQEPGVSASGGHRDRHSARVGGVLIGSPSGCAAPAMPRGRASRPRTRRGRPGGGCGE